MKRLVQTTIIAKPSEIDRGIKAEVFDFHDLQMDDETLDTFLTFLETAEKSEYTDLNFMELPYIETCIGIETLSEKIYVDAFRLKDQQQLIYRVFCNPMTFDLWYQRYCQEKESLKMWSEETSGNRPVLMNYREFLSLLKEELRKRTNS
ncbi:MAG: hypothetical protein ACFFC7_03915 [Candidatus Hermodarchaeota archaeon]